MTPLSKLTAAVWFLGVTALWIGCGDAHQTARRPAGGPPAAVTQDASPSKGRGTQERLLDAAAVPTGAAPTPVKPAPRAVIGETVHEFGTLSLHEMGTHRFAVRNEGTAPLRLDPIASSCKCIALEIERAAIPPGESGDVAVHWKSGEVQPQFAQAISLKSNDPDQPVVQFKVVGSYLPVVAAEPPELFLPRVRPDEPANGHALIVSQRWDAFTLEDLECSLEGVQWELKPAAEADLTRLQAKSGYHLHVTLPSELPEGPFMHWVRFTAAQPGDESAVQRLEMPLAGKVLRRIAVYGKGVDSSGILHLQTLTPGAKHEQRFLVRVHDREPALQVASIDASPAFLGVSLEPYGDGSKEDLYSLQITVPEDAAEGVYRGASAGRILVSFDHPRVRQLELGVDLIISPAGKLAIR